MNTWKTTASSAALLLLVTSGAAMAAATDAGPIIAPAPSSATFVDIAANHRMPAAILVNGQVLTLDRQPLIKDERLMVPLRFVAEAAGGKVTWDEATQSITVTMADRTGTFRVGQAEADLMQGGAHRLVTLALPVQVIDGRTLISADALTNVLGLVERQDADLNMDLLVRPDAAADSTQITLIPSAVAEADAPEALRAWASARKTEGAVPEFKLVRTDSVDYLAITGGEQPSGGYTIEIVSANQVNGTWVIEAKVVPPSGPADLAITNPVGYFSLNGIKGDLTVKMAPALPNAKVKGGDAQVTATAVAQSALPQEMRAWAEAQTVEHAAPAYKVVATDDGLLVGIAGGKQSTAGYRIELIGAARLVDGTWQIDARVVAPGGMAAQVLTNPVAFFKLPGVTGNVNVNFWTNGATP